MEKSFFKKSWPLLSIIILVGWSLLFWGLFIVGLSAEMLRVPIGLGGAYYFIFFLPPVIIGSAIYEVVIYKFIKEITIKKWLIYSITIPMVVITACLLIYCPMDTEQSFIMRLYKTISS